MKLCACIVLGHAEKNTIRIQIRTPSTNFVTEVVTKDR